MRRLRRRRLDVDAAVKVCQCLVGMARTPRVNGRRTHAEADHTRSFGDGNSVGSSDGIAATDDQFWLYRQEVWNGLGVRKTAGGLPQQSSDIWHALGAVPCAIVFPQVKLTD